MENMTKKEKVLYLIILLYFITLFFSKTTSINVIITAILVLYSFSFNSIQDKWELLKQRKPIQLMLLFFLVEVISILLSDNKERGLHYLNLHLPLLIFPVSIGLLHVSKQYKEKVLL